MALIPGFFLYNKNKGVVVWKFILFLVLCFILGILFVYFLIPEFFSGPIIEKIPIIIEEQNEEVMVSVFRKGLFFLK